MFCIRTKEPESRCAKADPTSDSRGVFAACSLFRRKSARQACSNRQRLTLRMASNASSIDSLLGSCHRYCSYKKFLAFWTSSNEASFDSPNSLQAEFICRCANCEEISMASEGLHAMNDPQSTQLYAAI
eukprot:305822-Pelagomonas_calceolata.AAC.2